MFRLFVLCLSIFFVACNQKPGITNPEQYNSELNSTLLRADPVYLNMLEKQSLLRQTPEKIRIVSGSNLAWRNPSSATLKSEFLKLSPAWFYANPTHFKKEQYQNYLESFLFSGPASLKKFGINAILLSPISQFDFNINIDFNGQHIESSQYNKNSSSVSFNFDEQIINLSQYKSLQSSMLVGGDMLSPSLGYGPDFILALNAVRDYPGLFVMTELPKKLWQYFPIKNTSNDIYEPYIISNNNDKTLLIEHGIIPKSFARDYLPSATKSNFAISSPIRGIDSIERRWVYRFVKNADTALLNYSDPSLNAQKLFSASIIQQVGVFRQALIGIKISDLWGQEVVNTSSNLSTSKLAEPALSALSTWNKAIHNYGAWSIIREAFPMELIPLLQGEGTDFVADTVFMPEFEKALLSENAENLKQNIQKALDLNIDFAALWHGSPDSYDGYFSERFFNSPTSMALAAKAAKISQQEVNNLQELIKLPSALQENDNLLKKYDNAKEIQYSYLAFQSLISGLPIITAYDLLGIIPKGNLPSFSLTSRQNPKNQEGIVLHDILPVQLRDKNSLASRLQNIFSIREQYNIGNTELIAIAETNSKIFAVILQNEQGKNYLCAMNISSESTQTELGLHKQFLGAKNLFNSNSYQIFKTKFKQNFKPWQIKFFELY